MKNLLAGIIFVLFLAGCTGNDGPPDVSGIKVEIPVERFDQDFFSIDTNNLAAGLTSLQSKYPDFYTDFMQQIVGVSGSEDDPVTLTVSREFLRGYLPVFEFLKKDFRETGWLKADLQKAFQFVKYYFPEYRTGNAVLFLGPFDAPGVAVTGKGLAIGLQQFAGKEFPAYQTMEAQQLFPLYISRRFEPQYIVANCMKAVIDDMYPDKSMSMGLVEQVIEKGKRWWLLDHFLPHEGDSVKTGYTNAQLDFCERNEGLIWQKIITDEKDLFTIEPVVIQSYIGEAPFTRNMGENSPGNIGPWIGWQIIKKFVAANPELSIDQVMKTKPRQILEEAKYKPK